MGIGETSRCFRMFNATSFFFFLRNQYFLATHESIGSLGVEGNYGYTPIEKNEKETALSLRSSTVAITYTKEKQK